MIKIYGTTLSNYYSTAKAALVEKGLAFEESLDHAESGPRSPGQKSDGQGSLY